MMPWRPDFLFNLIVCFSGAPVKKASQTNTTPKDETAPTSVKLDAFDALLLSSSDKSFGTGQRISNVCGSSNTLDAVLNMENSDGRSDEGVMFHISSDEETDYELVVAVEQAETVLKSSHEKKVLRFKLKFNKILNIVI